MKKEKVSLVNTSLKYALESDLIPMSEDDNPDKVREVFRVAFEATGSLTLALAKVWGWSFWATIIQIFIATVLTGRCYILNCLVFWSSMH